MNKDAELVDGHRDTNPGPLCSVVWCQNVLVRGSPEVAPDVTIFDVNVGEVRSEAL